MQANLFIIAAPSGAGKTSLVHALCHALPNIKVSVSHTTRQARPGEIEGINYFFTSVAEFQQKIKSDEFLEYAEVFGNYYGTCKAWVKRQLEAGTDVILEIDWQGARQVKSLLPQSIPVFILPPSREILRDRLQKRAQDHLSVIEQRMALACQEISHYNEYQYLVINDEFNKALEELKSIVLASRCLQTIQTERYRSLIDVLLNR